jgi:hypothetical protein
MIINGMEGFVGTLKKIGIVPPITPYYPTEQLPANGTVIVDIAEADDIDIETIPPEGITIVMTNTTITITDENIKTPDEDEEDEGY